MIIVSYDISSTKVRTKFSKFLSKFGYRLQYSVFSIKNSTRILQNIRLEIAKTYEPVFTQADSVIIMHLSKQCKIEHYGLAKNEEKDLIVID